MKKLNLNLTGKGISEILSRSQMKEILGGANVLSGYCDQNNCSGDCVAPCFGEDTKGKCLPRTNGECICAVNC